jgi:glutathionylspermidine synthase
MKRESSRPRPNWQARCEEVGFGFHSMGGTYWNESACYAFASDQVDRLEEATAELHRLCVAAAAEVVNSRRFAEFRIPAAFQDYVADSFRQGEPTLFGRFDLAWDGNGEPKLLEYNADTPTSLLEASVVQWHWLEETRQDADQFNSLHEKLLARWQAIGATWGTKRLALACVRDNEEDFGNTEYLRDLAVQAGFDASHLFIEDLGWNGQRFVDLEDRPVETLFKLYPWEWIAQEAFGAHVPASGTRFVEPAWKMLLSNKALLVVLWEMNYGHPNLLPAYFDTKRFGAEYVQKPLLSREGSNVTLVRRKGVVREAGSYGAEGFVYQGLATIPEFSGRYPVIGSWVVGDEAAGIGIREDDSPITKNSSHFVPHYFT